MQISTSSSGALRQFFREQDELIFHMFFYEPLHFT